MKRGTYRSLAETPLEDCEGDGKGYEILKFEVDLPVLG